MTLASRTGSADIGDTAGLGQLNDHQCKSETLGKWLDSKKVLHVSISGNMRCKQTSGQCTHLQLN